MARMSATCRECRPDWSVITSDDGPERDEYVVLCPLHEHAEALREALERLLRADERPPTPENLNEAVNAMSHARHVLAKTKEPPRADR